MAYRYLYQELQNPQPSMIPTSWSCVTKWSSHIKYQVVPQDREGKCERKLYIKLTPCVTLEEDLIQRGEECKNKVLQIVFQLSNKLPVSVIQTLFTVSGYSNSINIYYMSIVCHFSFV